MSLPSQQQRPSIQTPYRTKCGLIGIRGMVSLKLWGVWVCGLVFVFGFVAAVWRGGRDWGGARVGGWGGVGMVWGWESMNREVGHIGSRGIHGGRGSGVGVEV